MPRICEGVCRPRKRQSPMTTPSASGRLTLRPTRRGGNLDAFGTRIGTRQPSTARDGTGSPPTLPISHPAASAFPDRPVRLLRHLSASDQGRGRRNQQWLRPAPTSPASARHHRRRRPVIIVAPGHNRNRLPPICLLAVSAERPFDARGIVSYRFTWCGRGDLNSHVLSDNRF